MRILNLKELVKKYGSDAQKQALKKNGNLSGKETKIIMKTVMQHWESCTFEGRGSKRIFTCTGKRSKKADRLDRRSNNGSGQLVGESELKSLVLSFLVQKNNDVKPMSSNKWLGSIGIIDDEILNVLYGKKENDLQKIKKYFKTEISDYDTDELEKDMLDDFIQVFLGNLKSNLVSIFGKLNKEGVIVYKKQKWAYTVSNKHRRLKKDEIMKIDAIKEELLHFYNISAQEAFVKKDKKEVIAYKQDLNEKLRDQLGLNYYYDAHYCSINNKGMSILEFLDQKQEEADAPFFHRLTDIFFHIEIEKFKQMHSVHSLFLAKKREENTTKDYSEFSRVNFLKINKQYALMWELLLKYFGCYSVLKSNGCSSGKEGAIDPKVATLEKEKSIVWKRSIAEKKVTIEESLDIKKVITIKLDDVEFDVPKNASKANPLAQFKAIRSREEERRVRVNKTHLSYSIAE